MNTQDKFYELYSPYFDALDEPVWKQLVQDIINEIKDGNLAELLAILDDLPEIKKYECDLNSDVVSISGNAEYNDIQAINSVLRRLIPWRKGPFQIFDTFIDAEWQCQMKWNRIKDAISPLTNRTVLDVGSNNGYFGWRMRGAGAKQVIGIDPSIVTIIQFLAVNRLIKDYNHVVFPLKMEDIPPRLESFDTVFSMGVLYHRRGPLDHINELYEALRPGGELVIETIVVEGEDGMAFMPPGRYARMNNVWFLPSVPTLSSWLQKIGFEDVKTVDVQMTSIDEQRTTEWKPGVSLKEYLNPDDLNKTIEGHPGPLRATLIATKPKTAKRLKRYEL